MKNLFPIFLFLFFVICYALIIFMIASITYICNQIDLHYFYRVLTIGMEIFPMIGVVSLFFIAWFFPEWSKKRWYYYVMILSILIGYYIYIIGFP